MTPIEATALTELLRRQSTLVTPTVRINGAEIPTTTSSSSAPLLAAPTTSSAPTPTFSLSARSRALSSAAAPLTPAEDPEPLPRARTAGVGAEQRFDNAFGGVTISVKIHGAHHPLVKRRVFEEP